MVATTDEAKIRNEKDLEKYQGIFANTAFWKKLGEEYQNPLIVTGTVLFTPTQNSGFVMTEREVYDQFGRRRVVPVRTFQERKGFILRPKFIFIDGRTGRHALLRNVQRAGPLQRSAEHAGAFVVLRADGQADPELPERPEHAESPRLPHPAQVALPSGRGQRTSATAHIDSGR